jgi:hypothetical protein
MNVPELVRLARSEGVTVQLADLGEYSGCELRAEYDPCERAIRVNARLLRKIEPTNVATYLALAIAHELYHHREHVGRMRRLRGRRARERAADRFARVLRARPA